MSEVQKPDLADAVVAAVGATRVYIAERGKDLGYISTYRVPAFTVNEFGWPSTSTPYAGDGSSVSFPDWRQMIASRQRNYTRVTPADVVELQRVVEIVQSDPRFASRLSWWAESATTEERREEITADAALELVADVLGRADALDVDDEARLRELYRQREHAVMADELRADLIYPLALTQVDLDEPLLVADGIVLEPLDQATQRARVTSSLGVNEVNPYLVAAATHAMILQDVAVSNVDGPMRRATALSLRPPGLAEADKFFQALTIVAGREVGYAQVVLRPIGWADRWKGDLPPNENLATVRRFPAQFTDRGWLREWPRVTADSVRELPKVHAALTKTSARAKLAARRLAQSSLRDDPQDVLLDACIGLEALLGDGKDELSHRMGLRAATALAGQVPPDLAYWSLKRVYDHRSKIVHGNEPKNSRIQIGEKEFAPSSVAVYLLRQLLRAHLSATPPWDPAALDSRLLSSLAVAEKLGTQDL